MKIKHFAEIAATFAALSVTAFSGHAGESLDRIMSKGMIKVATNANWAPQSFINDDNVLDGFDINVAQEVAKRLGVNIEFITPDWSVMTAGKWNGRWDIAVGSMTPTAARGKVLDFPAIYYYSPASFAVHKDSKIMKKQELNGKRIGVCTACTYEDYMNGDLIIDAGGAPPFEYEVKAGSLVSMQQSSALMADLRLGDGVRLDAMLDGLPALLGAIEQGFPFRIVGKPAFYEPAAIATDKGDAELDAKLDAIVKKMHADGTMTRLSNKWYNHDYTIVE
jgi:polar amino acid transport system substrate-binding protein